jgi:hypothetical protein
MFYNKLDIIWIDRIGKNGENEIDEEQTALLKGRAYAGINRLYMHIR